MPISIRHVIKWIWQTNQQILPTVRMVTLISLVAPASKEREERERESQEVKQTTSKTKSSREKITEMLNEKRNKKTTKSIPVDQQLLALSKKEMTFKKDIFKQMEVQDERFNKSMNASQGNMGTTYKWNFNSLLIRVPQHQQRFATNSQQSFTTIPHDYTRNTKSGPHDREISNSKQDTNVR